MDFPIAHSHIDAQISAMKTAQQIEKYTTFKQCHDDESLLSALDEALFDPEICDDERIGALCYVRVVLQARMTGGLL
jgi:hypothetical protein